MSGRGRRTTHRHTTDAEPESYRFLTSEQISAHFDAPGAVTRLVGALTVADLLTAINAMPLSARQFVLSTIGAPAAQQANKAMAAQILARLKAGGTKRFELLSVLCVPTLAVFGHRLTREEWAALSGENAYRAAKVYVEHPDVLMFMRDLPQDANRSFLDLTLASAVASSTPGAFLALNLLGERDSATRAAYESLRLEHPDLPAPTTLDAISPRARAAALGLDISENAPAPEVHEAMVQHLNEHRDTDDEAPEANESGSPTQDGDREELVEHGWDAAADLARATHAALMADELPDQEDVRRLASFVESIHALAASLDADDRASLREALTAALTAGDVAPGRAWLLRLCAMTGPAQLHDDIAALVATADEAAHSETHARDEALLALLTLIDLSAAQRDGQPVDFDFMLTSRAVASAGLPEHEPIVFAAGAGLLNVPAPDDERATSTQAGPADETQSDLSKVPEELPDTPADLAAASEPEAETVPTPTADGGEADQEQGEPNADASPADLPEDDTAEPAEAAEIDLTSLPASLAKYLTPEAGADAESAEEGTDDASMNAAAPAPAHLSTDTGVDADAAGQGDLAWGTSKISEKDAHLIGSGRYGLAADIAIESSAPAATVAARLLGSYAAFLTNATGVMAAQFSQHAALVDREELGDDRAGQLTAWAAAAKAAILAPSAGPAEVLSKLAPCVSASPALTEVTAALIESARSGVVMVASESLEAAGASSAAQARARELSAQAEEIASRAKHRTIKYIPANDIYNEWLAPGGALEPVLSAVRHNDQDSVAAVRALLVEELRGRAERNIDTVFRAQQQHKGSRPRIIAQPRQQLHTRWDEIVDLAARWVQVCDEIAAQEAAEKSGSWHTVAVNRLRHRIHSHREQALDDLAVMGVDADIPAGAPHGPVALLEQTFAACDGRLPAGEEPPVAFAEHGELLNLAVALDANSLDPDEPVSLPTLLELADAPVPAPSQTYAKLSARGAHDLTGVLLAGLRASDPGAATSLDTERTQDILKTAAQVRTELTDVRDDIDLRRVAGVLGDDLWARASTQAESLTEPGRRDYERIRAGVAQITAELDQEQDGRIEHLLRQIEAHATENATVAEHQETLTRLATAGQVASAEEQLQQLLEGVAPTTSSAHGEHLGTFFPSVAQALRGRSDSLERLNQALRTGEHNEVTTALAEARLDLLVLTDARRKQAREAFSAWRELASSSPVINGTTEIDKLRIILRQAGIEFRAATKESGNRDRQLLTLTGVDVLGKALTPTLGSERAPDSSLRVLLVRKAATPATIIEWMATQPKDRTILVLWLARMSLTAAEWRAIVEAARGRTSNPPAVVMDSSSLVYLAAQAEPRLSSLAAIALPFAATNPYKDTPGDTAPEMFYGRTEERAAILDLNGSSFVSGGRQLGKSALLRHAARTFNDASPDHVAIVMSIFRVGKRNDPEQVWADLWPELAAHGIVSGPVPDEDVAGATYRGIRAWIGQDTARQLLLLLDEADDFLDADATNNRFDNVEWFRRLMLETNRSVKVVLAGLHRTARFESLPNQPLPHLGKPIVVGPLRPQHARDLLTGPLAAIGYHFDSDITVAQVLAQANNMPAQLQLIGEALVEYMSSRPVDPDGPPTIITSDDVTAAFTPKLREDLRGKFTLTLTLDPRYKVIAYVVAQASHEHGSDASLSLGELSAECRNAWPEGFANLGADAFRGLVAECVDLGVLARDSNRYRLRTPTVRRLLGTEIEVFEELASASETLKVPATYDGSVYRRQVAKLENAISPLTERQLGALLGERRAVVVVAGSTATGLGKVIPTIEEVVGTVQHGGTAHRCGNTRPEGVAAAIGKAAGRTRLLVDARTLSAPQLTELLRVAEEATERTQQDVTTVVVAGPQSASAWVQHVNRIDLERIGRDGMRLLVGADVLPFHDQRDQERVVTELGGWPVLLSQLTDLYRDGTRRLDSAGLLREVSEDILARPGRLAAAAGVSNGQAPALTIALRHIADLTGRTPEDRVSVAELLEVFEDPELTAAMAAGGYTSTLDVVDALIALACLQSDGSGLWSVDHVLAADLGEGA